MLQEAQSSCKGDLVCLSKRVRLDVRYSFVRSYPKTALNPVGNQTLPVDVDIVDGLIKSLTGDSDTEITIGGFQPILTLGQTMSADQIAAKQLGSPTMKKLILKYHSQDEQWTLRQEIGSKQEEAFFSKI